MSLAVKFWEILCELAPWFLIGALLAGLMHGLAPLQFVKKRLRGYQGVVWASLFGIPLPLCSCAVIPTGLGLRKSGASEGASVGFLISTPQTGVDSILVTAAILGWPFALFKMVVALILGTVAGWIIEFHHRVAAGGITPPENSSSAKRSLSLPVIQPAAEPAALDPSTPINRSIWAVVLDYMVTSLKQGLEIMRSIYNWVLIGVLVSAMLSLYLPVGSIQNWLGPGGSWLQVPMTLLLSLPLYVCATASVPIAGALVNGGLSVGATIVFLIAGPATNLATIGALYRNLSRFAFVTYLVTVILGSIAAAFLFDGLISGIVGDTSLFGELPESHDHLGHTHMGPAQGHDHSSVINQVSAALLLSLFGWFYAERFGIRKWFEESRARLPR